MTKLRNAKCCKCGILLTPSSYRKEIKTRDRGTQWACGECQQRVHDYSATVEDVRQSVTKNKNIYGLEVELSGYTNVNNLLSVCTRLEANLGWKKTYDCTVQLEMKTPKYYSLNGLPKTLTSLFQDLGGYPDDESGAHINVSDEDFNEYEFDAIREHYNIIFREMYDYLMANPSDCKKLFGRSLNGWCNRFGKNYHETAFNVESKKASSPRIEIRVARITSVDQYMNALKFASVMMTTIRNNFLNHLEINRYGNVTNWEKAQAKAQITSAKLLKQLQKAIEKA